jgi:hypothetical protein
MSFYAQLDGLPKPSEFDLADAGLIFICFDCFQTADVLDSAQLREAGRKCRPLRHREAAPS